MVVPKYYPKMVVPKYWGLSTIGREIFRSDVIFSSKSAYFHQKNDTPGENLFKLENCLIGKFFFSDAIAVMKCVTCHFYA